MRHLFYQLAFLLAISSIGLELLAAERVDTLWTAFWDGPEHWEDEARSVCASGNGDLYVTGFVSTLSGDYDIVLIKYNHQGDTIWVRTYAGIGGTEDLPTRVFVDGNGNVLVSGSGGADSATVDGLLLKYSSSGNLLWYRAFDRPLSGNARLMDIDADSNGNVGYVGVAGQLGSRDMILGKMGPSGDTLWSMPYNSPGNLDDVGTAVDLNQNGNLVAVGTGLSASTNYDIVTIKVNPDGDTNWVRVFNYFGTSSDKAVDLCVDSSGAAYVVGYCSELSGQGEDCIILKYADDGTLQWTRTYGFEPGNYDYPADAVLDRQNNLLVTGRSYCDSSWDDVFLLKLNSDGDSLWSRRYSSMPNGGSDEGMAIAVDHDNNIYIGGGSSYSSLIIKFNEIGERIWVSRGPGGVYNKVFDVALIGDTVCAVGRYDNTYSDIVTAVLIGFVSGDADGSGVLTISDVVFLINYIFGGGPAPNPLSSGDADCSGAISISDAVYLIQYIFGGGPMPCEG